MIRHDEGSADARPRHRRVWVLLAVIVAMSGTAHFVGIHRDLPSPDVDEPFFVLPAVQMASSGSLDPHWFGHPGSTVILPLALAYRAREVLFHGAPLVGRAPSVVTRFRSDGNSFYFLGRLWTVLLSLASVVLLFLLARRLFDDTIGLIAALCYGLVPIVVNYGRTVRTDSAGACFGLLALLAIDAMVERPTTRRFVATGAAIGLAVASRYFLVALVPIAIAAWVVARPPGRRPRIRDVALLGAAAFVAFALVTPFFFFDRHAVVESVLAETRGPIGNGHHDWLQSLDFYLRNAVPDAIGWPAYVAAIVGMAWTVVRGTARRRLLVAFAVVFVATISISSLVWPRWIIPALPVLLLFAAATVVTGARRVAARVPQDARPATRGVLVAVGACAIGLFMVVMVVRLDRQAEAASTRERMRAWIVAHVPRSTPIAEEIKAPELRTAGYPTLQRFDLPHDGTVADYLAHGYHDFVVNAYVALDYRVAPLRYPRHAAFYEFLRRHAKLLHDEPGHGDCKGPHLKLYRVDLVELVAAHGRVDRSTTQRSRRDRLDNPAPFYPVGDALLR